MRDKRRRHRRSFRCRRLNHRIASTRRGLLLISVVVVSGSRGMRQCRLKRLAHMARHPRRHSEGDGQQSNKEDARPHHVSEAYTANRQKCPSAGLPAIIGPPRCVSGLAGGRGGGADATIEAQVYHGKMPPVGAHRNMASIRCGGSCGPRQAKGRHSHAGAKRDIAPVTPNSEGSCRAGGGSEAERLNRGCFSITFNRAALSEALDREVGIDGFAKQLAETSPPWYLTVLQIRNMAIA